ncbi:recombination regulator RecX [Nocardiopsis suaedae]|uniref:Regulatory protein RecX n=1 Tax=Nocardiopsis suaedae TaxID=3018444 RepID=A0ABT4TF26_9ACTN|nr:recombination regulator RecX [Nocardiopsis suaedae]MDA2802894.1 recombination regulator RecX [Nocardiopsis suaedae]
MRDPGDPGTVQGPPDPGPDAAAAPDPRSPDQEAHGEHAADEDPESYARTVCLRLLTVAPRTRAQLAEALRTRGVEEPVAETVLERFGEVGLIDDAAFSAAWVESRHTGRGLGRRALAGELRRRGVDEETVRDAVDDISADQEEATARDLVRRKLAGTRGRDDAVRVRRAMGMLARKGYPAGLAYRVIREELEAEGSDLELPDPDL